jgi:G:T/U-mismatch repair DNA glycosylase
MRTHPFKPYISKATRKLLVGTLPPEGVSFYFSHSSNTRLWDILKAIMDNAKAVGKGGNELSKKTKIAILDSLGVGITDIIYCYQRDVLASTKDLHIDPKKYNDLLRLVIDNNIEELIFVYQSAYKWFVHSLDKKPPVRLRRLKLKCALGSQKEIIFEGKRIKCTLLPSPLNRGLKGQTLAFKLDFYRKYITGHN